MALPLPASFTSHCRLAKVVSRPCVYIVIFRQMWFIWWKVCELVINEGLRKMSILNGLPKVLFAPNNCSIDIFLPNGQNVFPANYLGAVCENLQVPRSLCCSAFYVLFSSSSSSFSFPPSPPLSLLPGSGMPGTRSSHRVIILPPSLRSQICSESDLSDLCFARKWVTCA